MTGALKFAALTGVFFAGFAGLWWIAQGTAWWTFALSCTAGWAGGQFIAACIRETRRQLPDPTSDLNVIRYTIRARIGRPRP